jgi:hypothetical protein
VEITRPGKVFLKTAREALAMLDRSVGLWRKPTAVFAALLTLSFALSMTVVLGPHEPLNYSVFVFAFASLYLGLFQDVE